MSATPQAPPPPQEDHPTTGPDPAAPDPRPATAPDRGRLALVLLVLVSALTVELVRSSGPLLDHAFAAGIATVALTALATYAAPGVLVVMIAARLELTGKVVLLAVAALVVARLALQGLGTAVAAGADLGLVRYGVGLASVALAVAALVLVAAFASGTTTSPPGPARAGTVALGVGLGTLLAAAVSATLGTWDAYWRPGLLAWTTTVAVSLGALAVAWLLRGREARPGARGLWLLGPALALAVQVLANPAFVASQADVPVPAAVAALAVAALATAAAVPWAVGAARGGRRVARAVAVWGAPLLVVAGVAVTFLAVPRLQGPGVVGGWVLLALLTVLVPAAAVTLALCLLRPARPLTWLRLAGTASVAGLGIVVPLLGYQIDYDVPLPVRNGWVPVATAALLAVVAVVRGTRAGWSSGAAPEGTAPDRSESTAAPLVVAAGVGVVALLGVTQVLPPSSGVAAERVPGDLRVLDWNLHYGVSADPSVPLDDVVRTIESSRADVVTLQEVSRGWVLGGGVDMESYLARATGMRSVAAPAADRQFVNVILWDPALGDLTDVARHALPYGAGPQQRSAISGTVDADGVPVRVTSVHLQHREENTPTRLDQLDALLTDEPVDGAYVLAGDLNAEPGWDELILLEDAGLESGQDVAGDPDALTSPAVAPAHRIDWVLGSSAVTFRSFEVLDDTSSDHRPLLTEIRAAG
ncbi:endonuclease/exonuclease/phosphatase family protein [Cellulosimicrobium marinum]|uniref:endonuclease/exonuclease/phosphatase family protein n=1 Tax=Cellulosimicrobium marinum TaxID=1638992 RepID=UPI001E31FEC9|nr:endonuclease/exonuclease/phosphatase family protein [Cellulosimicrobium marinum]MCB7136476.1 endonuclease/exonuclease/phosphatase family protein [Cellulosimicrobium marinum]